MRYGWAPTKCTGKEKKNPLLFTCVWTPKPPPPLGIVPECPTHLVTYKPSLQSESPFLHYLPPPFSSLRTKFSCGYKNPKIKECARFSRSVNVVAMQTLKMCAKQETMWSPHHREGLDWNVCLCPIPWSVEGVVMPTNKKSMFPFLGVAVDLNRDFTS